MGDSGVELRLINIESNIADLTKAVKELAVQNNRLTHVEKGQDELWEKYDALAGPNGVIAELKNFQASCPRKNLKAVYIPVGIALIAAAASFLKGAFR